MSKASLTEGAITFKGKEITAIVGSITWNENPKTLSLYSFSILPKLSREESFKIAITQKTDQDACNGSRKSAYN